jgi:L-ornithine N5-oxygenase
VTGIPVRPLDLLGVGLGPANLALAAAVADCGAAAPSAWFLERDRNVSWHAGALTADSRLQVSFLKDLATLRDPRSPFTFLAYLSAHGRLADFVSLCEWHPSREEFGDYFSWAAAQLGGLVQLSSEVTSIAEAPGGFRVEASLSGAPLTVTARCVVIGAGRRPHRPSFAPAHPRVAHSSELLPWLAREFPDREAPVAVAVAGGGQSGVEAALHIHGRYPRARVELLYPRYSLRRIDANPFVNEHFSAAGSRAFHVLEDHDRAAALTDLDGTNTGVVEDRLLELLWRACYEDKRRAAERLVLTGWSELRAIDSRTMPLTCHGVRRDGTGFERRFDGVVLATGYTADAHEPLIGPLADRVIRDAAGRPRTDASHRVLLRPEPDGALFLHGLYAEQHGPAEPNLSCCATRAQTILDAVRGRLAARPAPRSLAESGVGT